MLKQFELNAGEVIKFQGHKPSDVINKLKELKGFVKEDDESFLRSKAEGFVAWSGKTIRFDSPESFAEDLMDHGILSEITK